MLLSPRLGKFKRVREFLWNSRCPLCGDSQKNKNKARLYFYQKKNSLFVKCHNCGAGMSVGNFIKICVYRSKFDFIRINDMGCIMFIMGDKISIC